MNRRMTDREVYPAIWVTLAALLMAFLGWKYLLGQPTVSGCWFYSRWGVYCPGCGGTRALIALGKGRLLQALWYHPAVPVTALWAGAYLLSQTLWRLRGKRGRVLRYHPACPVVLLWLILANWLLKNLLLFFEIVL